ncbi:SMP-30/gluconolactonase/LRE family protein [Rhodopila sp.]|jgi:sugar lactone lactonase YvrE|uniref:SMP-30/gluconolactonase/LRE family protein n=1 Tax=Rhodopila sp. TaxID=2480087 RepID=UPI002B5C7CCF|nr:SMP-30/gluconolactonase/LRE family protein [Rhodopila sp.]HVZ06979.1 SMP-30/gluconolactonase/LRE family protein [Rhodopila sp.]
MSEFELVWDAKCGVAESPVWDAPNDRLLFCDIPGQRIYVLGLSSGSRDIWDFPEVVGSFGLCRSGRLVVALKHHVVLFDPRTRESRDLTPKVAEPDTSRFNDGKVGPDGAFWVGTIDGNAPRQPTASLYRVTADGAITREETGIANSNGLAWTPDGRTMFHADTAAGIIEAWDFDPATGARSHHRVLAKLTNDQGRPDGAATDMDGNYWSAGPSAGVLHCFSPSGTLLRRLDFPVPGPTMPCFAGDRLFATSLREGKSDAVLAEFPSLGGLFAAPAPARGAPVDVFAD